jgi:peptidoglycan-associated lipoprotein
MRTFLTAIIIVSLVFFTACGGKKQPEQTPGLDAEQIEDNDTGYATESVSDPITTTEDLTEEPADDRIDFDQGQGIEEVPLEEMTLEEINAKEFLKNIYFEFDQYDLTDSAIEQLQQNGNWLLEHENVKVIIEGHCDERGTEEYNIALGERRANSAREFLIRMGVDPARMTTVSYGESRPMVDENNAVAWAKNRRVHFRIYER